MPLFIVEVTYPPAYAKKPVKVTVKVEADTISNAVELSLLQLKTTMQDVIRILAKKEETHA